jgi:hypothetical protein
MSRFVVSGKSSIPESGCGEFPMGCGAVCWLRFPLAIQSLLFTSSPEPVLQLTDLGGTAEKKLTMSEMRRFRHSCYEPNAKSRPRLEQIQINYNGQYRRTNLASLVRMEDGQEKMNCQVRGNYSRCSRKVGYVPKRP